MDADLPLPLTQRLSRRTWVALDVALAVLLLGATIASIAVGHERRGPTGSAWDGLRYAAAILACASLPLRRRWPVPVLVATVVGDATLVVLGGTGPAQVAVAFAVYTVAATSARRLSLWAVGAVVATMLGAALVAYGGPEWGSVIGGPAVVLLGWIAGENTRARVTYAAGLAERAAEREREREQRVRQAAIDERLRIARELHDIVAHAMSLISVRAGAARMVVEEHPDEAQTALSIIETTSRRALREMRRLVGVLRQPDDLGPADLEPAPSLSLVGDLVRQSAEAGVHVDLNVTGDVRALPEGVDVSAYRIVQEALTNVVRHAGPTRARLRVDYGRDEVRIELLDEGQPALAGARPPGLANAAGHGLVGMRERVALYGGDLITERMSNGFRVEVRLPIDEELP
jgi:signal transduction histidine kinase